MKTITFNLYSFPELDREAKQKALISNRELNFGFEWWDSELEDFVNLCGYMGIRVLKETINFRGFYCQGDGSCFSAIVDIARLQLAIKEQSWKTYAPKQEFNLMPAAIDHRVMNLVAKGLLPDEPQIICRKKQFGIVVDLGIYVIDENGKEHPNIFDELQKLEEWLRSVGEVLNNHLFNSIENQYDYLCSDAAVEESFLNNDFLFTADGKSANHLEKLNNI
ncbi:hypothetical protein [Mucilaginibacter rubeus]|uniref:hypothetical protein n=1 Tax=Mucilaginibacter rubeus TaxID=2027860 RepID=UPI001666BC13|nr:hypothetical protein [Mucilaginibacter rubeus]GGA95860.1 hypothetical protein GCM10011500_09570 [Mucilaginibacter rubeus]